MISATLDANTIVSATLVDGGNPWKVLAAARAGLFRCVTSSVIVNEVLVTLGKDRIQRKYHIDAQAIDDLSSALSILSRSSRGERQGMGEAVEEGAGDFDDLVG